jgi:hypothetical protein
MATDPRVCDCGAEIELTNITQCPSCGRGLGSIDEIIELDQSMQRATGGHPEGLREGALKRAEEEDNTTVEEPMSRREFFSMFTSIKKMREKLPQDYKLLIGIYGASVATTALSLGLRRASEDAWHSSRLTEEDILSINQAALPTLPDRISSFEATRRYAAASYARALAGHLAGTTPGQATEIFSVLLSNKNISPIVRSNLLERRAKSRVWIGEAAKGLDDQTSKRLAQ